MPIFSDGIPMDPRTSANGAASGRHIVIVHCACDIQVGVRVEPCNQFVSLIAKVALHLVP